MFKLREFRCPHQPAGSPDPLCDFCLRTWRWCPTSLADEDQPEPECLYDLTAEELAELEIRQAETYFDGPPADDDELPW